MRSRRAVVAKNRSRTLSKCCGSEPHTDGTGLEPDFAECEVRISKDYFENGLESLTVV